MQWYSKSTIFYLEIAVTRMIMTKYFIMKSSVKLTLIIIAILHEYFKQKLPQSKWDAPVNIDRK
jgi:hypothetical protein